MNGVYIIIIVMATKSHHENRQRHVVCESSVVTYSTSLRDLVCKVKSKDHSAPI